MIVTEQKKSQCIMENLQKYESVFLVGCGECATVCKTGGQEEIDRMKELLEAKGKKVSGSCVPQATCIAANVKKELAKNAGFLREAEVILVFACGAGVQSVKANNRLELPVLPGCNTLFAAEVDGLGNLYERCSMCGECVLDSTAGICPMTLCAKGLLNGPCGGMDKGKCEVDKEKDCAWVLIYKALEKQLKTGELRNIQAPRNFKKITKPQRLILHKNDTKR